MDTLQCLEEPTEYAIFSIKMHKATIKKIEKNFRHICIELQ